MTTREAGCWTPRPPTYTNNLRHVPLQPALPAFAARPVESYCRWREECAQVFGVVGAARWRYEYGLPQPQCLRLGQRNAVVHGIGRSIDTLLCAYVRKRGNGHTS